MLDFSQLQTLNVFLKTNDDVRLGDLGVLPAVCSDAVGKSKIEWARWLGFSATPTSLVPLPGNPRSLKIMPIRMKSSNFETS